MSETTDAAQPTEERREHVPWCERSRLLQYQSAESIPDFVPCNCIDPDPRLRDRRVAPTHPTEAAVADLALLAPLGLSAERSAAYDRLRARLTGEAQGRDLVEIAATHGKTLNLRIYPYHRVYAWWGVEDGDEDGATEGNGNDALSIALRALRAAPPTAKAESPFKLPVRVVEGERPEDDGAAKIYLVDGDGAFMFSVDPRPREWADCIAAAINAHAPTAKAPGGGEVRNALVLADRWLEDHATGKTPAETGEYVVSELVEAIRVPTPDEPATKCPDCGAAHRPSRGCPMIGGSDPEGEATDDA